MNQRQYTAIFAVGAKLQASFNSTMDAARRGLIGLQNTARHMAAGIGSAVSRIGRAFVGMATLIGGLAIGKLLHDVFKDSGEEAIKAQQAHLKIVAGLGQLRAIRPTGPRSAEAQTEQIEAYNEQLAKRQLYGKLWLDQMSAELAFRGVPPKQIMESTKALSSMLAVSKGVTATEQDAVDLARKFAMLVKTGQGRSQEFRGLFSKEQLKSLQKLTDSGQRYKRLMELLGSKKFQDDATRVFTSVEAKRFLFDRHMQEMTERIGRATRSIRGEMYDALNDLQTVAEPILTSMARGVAIGARAAAVAVRDFARQMESPPSSKAWKNLQEAFRGFTIAATGKKKDEDMTVGGLLTDKAPIGTKLGRAATGDMILITRALNAMKPLIEATKLAAPGIWKELTKDLDTFSNAIDSGSAKIIEAASRIGAAFWNYLVGPLKEAQAAWDSAASAWGNRPTWLGGTGGGARGGAAPPGGGAPAVGRQGSIKPGMMAIGGIVRQRSLWQLAEHGPEVVIPLTGGARANKLLDYANSVLGRSNSMLARSGRAPAGTGGAGKLLAQANSMLGRSASGTSISFAPNITIHGNATPQDQELLQTTLRDVAKDFIEDFKSAQYHERRLSYESGYG